MSQTVHVLGMFPALAGTVGGVEASGREAWSAVSGRVGEKQARALYYHAGESRLGTAFQTLRWRGTDLVLVWHLDLLKLVPLVRRGARIALFLHGVEAWRRQGPLTRRLLDHVDLFLVNTAHTWSRFLEFQPALRDTAHRIVHLGLGETATNVPQPAAIAGALMISRLDRGEDYKGHRQMIAAWSRVAARVPGAQLWIAGDGDLRPDLERLAAQSAPAASVRFLGRVSESEKERLLADCRCLALPSRGEGFGLVYVEAMRLGRPCLVSHADAGREVVNAPEAGLAVDPDDVESTADAVARLLTAGDEWVRWSAQAKARYDSRFTSGQFQQHLVAALFES